MKTCPPQPSFPLLTEFPILISPDWDENFNLPRLVGRILAFPILISPDWDENALLALRKVKNSFSQF